jgi:hypothetical protein
MSKENQYHGGTAFNFEYKTEAEKKEHERRCADSGNLEKDLDEENVRFKSTTEIEE